MPASLCCEVAPGTPWVMALVSARIHLGMLLKMLVETSVNSCPNVVARVNVDFCAGLSLIAAISFSGMLKTILRAKNARISQMSGPYGKYFRKGVATKRWLVRKAVHSVTLYLPVNRFLIPASPMV